jgi:hypothetical protein
MPGSSTLPLGRAWGPSRDEAVNATSSPTTLVPAVAGTRVEVESIDVTPNVDGTLTISTGARALVGPVSVIGLSQYAYGPLEGDDGAAITISFTVATQIGGTIGWRRG